MKNNFWQKLNRPILALAPMAGISDSAFRAICKKYGADVTYSEMASVSALFFKPEKTLELVRFNKNERPYVVQLFGKTPEHFAKAARIISEADSPLREKSPGSGLSARPDGIDINFGCPAKKVFGHGSGCALMPQKELAREIISAVCENTDLPVSLKIRAGIAQTSEVCGHRPPRSANHISALEFIKNTKDLPYSAVMVHGRTYESGFSGKVDFDIVSEIKKIIPEKIVLGNGGILTPEDAVNILKKHPTLDGLGIARGAWGRPFIFDEIKSLLLPPSPVLGRGAGGDGNAGKYDFAAIKKIMLEHAALIYKDKGLAGKFEMRKHLAWYVKGFPGAQELRRRLVMAESLSEIKNILDNFTAI
jgi:tRNA-dihydrouridine synthase B